MTPADLERLQKYMLEVEGTDPILDEMSAESKPSGQNWYKLPPRRW